MGNFGFLIAVPSCSQSPVAIYYVFMGEIGDGVAAAGERLLWQRGNYVSITNALSTWDWYFEFVGLPVDDIYTLLCPVLMDLVDRFVPSRAGNAKHLGPFAFRLAFPVTL